MSFSEACSFQITTARAEFTLPTQLDPRAASSIFWTFARSTGRKGRKKRIERLRPRTSFSSMRGLLSGDASHRYFRVAAIVRQTADRPAPAFYIRTPAVNQARPLTLRGAFPDTTPPPVAHMLLSPRAA